MINESCSISTKWQIKMARSKSRIPTLGEQECRELQDRAGRQARKETSCVYPVLCNLFKNKKEIFFLFSCFWVS